MKITIYLATNGYQIDFVTDSETGTECLSADWD
jgi:hypothetical protein